MYSIKIKDRNIHLLDKDNIDSNKLKKITSKKKYTVFIDEYDKNSYECKDCQFRYIYQDVFIKPLERFIHKIINLWLIHYKRHNINDIIQNLSYEDLISKIGFDKKLDRLPKEVDKLIFALFQDTFDYYISKIKSYNIETLIDKLSIFIYDIYIILLFLTNKNTIFIIDKEHIKNILLIHKLVLENY